MKLFQENEHLHIAIVALLVLVVFTLQNPVAIVATTIVCAIYAIKFGNASVCAKSAAKLIIVSGIISFPAFFKQYNGFSPIYYYVGTLVSLAVADIFSRNPKSLLKALQLAYGISAVFILFFLLVYWGDPEPLGRIVEGASTNGIPSYLIILQICLSLCFFSVHGRLPMLTPLVTALVAFYGIGRGSLVVSAMLILATFVLNALVRQSHRRQRILNVLLAALLIGALAYYGETWYDEISSQTKLGVGLEDEHREIIFDEYTGKLEFYSSIFGADYSETSIESYYGNNPHISFIRTHSFYGILITALAIGSPFLAFLGKNAKFVNIVYFIFLALAVIRASSEPILFPTLLDSLYFTCVFLCLKHGVAKDAENEKHLV